jgi:hypothetical protein
LFWPGNRSGCFSRANCYREHYLLGVLATWQAASTADSAATPTTITVRPFSGTGGRFPEPLHPVPARLL